MNIVCLDMEGVLVPEIWIAFSKESGIPYQTLINMYLTDCVEHKRKLRMSWE